MKAVRGRAIFLLLLCVPMLLFCACGILQDAAKLETYDLGNDKIPSLTSVVGERKVSGVETGSRTGGVQYKNYTYETQTLTEDMDAYYAALLQSGYLVTKSSEGNTMKGSLELGRNSADAGKAILIGLAWDNTLITLSITKGDGTITAT